MNRYDFTILACSSSKKAMNAGKACELYDGELFKKAYAVARLVKSKPLILSAKYGLLLPDTVIETYNETLNHRPRRYCESWGVLTSASLGNQNLTNVLCLAPSWHYLTV